MIFTKEIFYNIALSALLLSEQVDNVETTTNSNSISVLNTFWDIAWESTLQDLDLDALSTPQNLELIEEVDQTLYNWTYAYKYPSNCAFLRRIQSHVDTDNKDSQIPKRIAQYNGQRAIFTNQAQARVEMIPIDVDYSSLNAMAGLAVGYKLADLSAALLVGKGAKKLREMIQVDYLKAKTEAQETDRLENFNFEDDALRSEFVNVRMS